MKANKNIDRLFQEKLKDFEVSPPDNIWKGIERNLNTNKPKSTFPLWVRIGSAVAILIFLTIGGVSYFNSESPDINNNTIVNDSESENTPKINKEILKKDILNSTENGNVITESENDERINVTYNDNAPKINIEILKSDVLNSTKNEKVIAEVENNSSINVIGSNNENTPKNNKEILKSDLLKSDKNEKVITEVKNNIVSNKKISDNEQILKNKVTEIQSKIEANNLIRSNSKMSTNNNSLKQEESLIYNKNTNLNATQSDKIKNNATKVNVSEDLIVSKNKILNEQIDLNITTEVEDKITQIEIKKIELSEDLQTKNIEKEEDNKKWSVASVIAPIAYNSFNAKGSPLDLQFENSPKQGSKTMSYGVKVGYRINEKLSLQSGITMVDVGYKVGDVFVNPSQQGLQKLTNVNYSNAANILNVQAGDILNNVQLETTSSVPIKGVLNQEFGYLEVPLELKYKLNNSKKIGVNLIGGFSTLILNKNEVSVETSEFSSNLGEANNLNNVNFSGNLGIDIDYKINKNLYINVAPMLKIHTSTFSKNADNFKPYIIGVYSGLNYKF